MSLLDRAISLLLPAVPKSIVRYFSRRYIAGPSLDDALAVVKELALQGAVSTLDILGEFIATPEAALQNTRSYETLIQRVHQDRLRDAHISVKLTALGLLIDQELCRNNLRRLLEQARTTDNFVRIDMEDSACTAATLEIYTALREDFPDRVGVALQSRLRRTLDDVDRLTTRQANIRLCKGIYLEPRTIAYTEPEIIRRNFTAALDRLLERDAYVGIATHDELLVCEALQLIREHSLERNQYEFQMLLGVDEPLRGILLDTGHRVRIYVPFGEHWYPYSVRRLRENPQIAGYAFKAMFQRSPPRPDDDKSRRKPSEVAR